MTGTGCNCNDTDNRYSDGSGTSSSGTVNLSAMTGGVIKYDMDNIDTDVIIPGQYLKVHDYAELATHAMEGLDPDFHSKVQTASFIVAGRNFGCGSSREHAPIALSHSGIRAVAALSFARIFYRNSVDGAFLLPIEIGRDAYDGVGQGDTVTVDIGKGIMRNETTGISYGIKPFPDIIRKIIDAGGLFKYGMQRRRAGLQKTVRRNGR